MRKETVLARVKMIAHVLLDMPIAETSFSPAIRQQIMQNLDGTVTGLSCWAAELEDLQETPAQRETQPEASEQTRADSISLSM